MNRYVQSGLWAAAGLLLAGWALLVPGHFRAIDLRSLEYAGRGTPSLLAGGQNLVNLEQLGPARVFHKAATFLEIPETDQLGLIITQAMRSLPAKPLPTPTQENPYPLPELWQPASTKPILDVLLEGEIRQKAGVFVQASHRPGVHEILKNRNITNTTEFIPATLPGGQPLDATILLTALLSQTDRLSPQLREEIEGLAFQANTNAMLGPMETVYLDILALGQKMDWQQIGHLLAKTDRITSLRTLTQKLGATEEAWPVVYAAAVLSEKPDGLARYLVRFPETAMKDIQTALRYGKGAIAELLGRQQRIYAPRWRLGLIGYDPFATIFDALVPSSIAAPISTALFRWLLFFTAAFCLARAVGVLAFPWQVEAGESVDSARLAQEMAVLACIFFVAAVSSEPFLVQNVPKPASKAAPGGIRISIPGAIKPNPITRQAMSISTLTPLLIFFVLQALIYIWCLAKLAEIRRQEVGPRIKLRLLENEDHLFDAGLYLGFAGTVISLILVSMGVISQSIMAAYSSTSFGIIFVSILKICHIRPLRRRLILESEEVPLVEQVS